MWWLFIVLCIGVYFFVLFAPYVCYHILVKLATNLANSCSFGLRNVFMV